MPVSPLAPRATPPGPVFPPAAPAFGPQGWLAPALVAVLAITALRLGLLAYDRTDLFVDEAQYWLWGQSYEFGYYSKPPLIGWLIGAVTALAGSDAVFWIRSPGPVLHAITALLVGALAARFGRGAAIVAALGYVTLPMVAVSSLLISTDAVMLPFLALAILCHLAALQRGARGWPWALLAGLALGAAFMAKYAALYFAACALVAALSDRRLRLPLGSVLALCVGFGLVISPNIVWNVQNDLVTLGHTADNIRWIRTLEGEGGNAQPLATHLADLAEFFFGQFAVFGPVGFGLLLLAALGFRKPAPEQAAALRLRAVLLAFSLPVVGLVCLQALASGAYANWAAAAYLAGAALVYPLLLRLPRVWLGLAFAVNGALALALPLAATQADRLTLPGGDLALGRYIGQAEMSRAILSAAVGQGIGAIVADDRAVLADLFYTGRDAGIVIYSVPPTGRSLNHYAQRYPYRGDAPGDILFATTGSAAPTCAPDAPVLTRIAPPQGAYAKRPVSIFRLPGGCWLPPA